MQGRSLRILVVGVLTGFVLLGFQNCGGGFTPADPADPVDDALVPVAAPDVTEALLQGTTPAKALIVNPAIASGNPQFAFDGNLSPLLSNVLLIEPKAGLNYLATDNFKIMNDDEYPQEVARPALNLEFAPTEPEFLQVNVYYHLSRFERTLQLLQVFPSNFIADLEVRAHCNTGEFAENNAYFSPEEKLLCMGYANLPNFKAWSALDSDVIIHEFGHAINSSAATEDVFFSSMDLWALDEGFSDVWAYLMNEQVHIANWFARAIFTVFNPSGTWTNEGLRDFTDPVNYPTSLQLEAHDDGIVFGSVFHVLKTRGVSKANLHRLAIRILEDLQSGDNNSDVARYMIEEGEALGISRVLLVDVLSERGLYRKDSLDNVTLSSTSGLVVVDNHAFGILQNGNCNRALDVGEVAVILPDFANSGAAIGALHYRARSSSTNLTILPGGDFGNAARLSANSTLLNSIPRNELRPLNLIFPALVVVASAAGTYQITIDVQAFNSVDQQAVMRSYTVPITVGTVPNLIQNCPNGLEESIWP